MAREQDIIQLPFRITELNEDMLLALNRNFSEIERILAQLQLYEKSTGKAINNKVINSGMDEDGVLPTEKLSDLLVGLSHNLQLANGAVDSAKLAVAAVLAQNIADQAVEEAKIAIEAVTTEKIAPESITTAKIVAGAITTAKLAAGAVTANELAAGAVTAGKIQAGSIATEHIAADGITADKITSGQLLTNKVTVAGDGGYTKFQGDGMKVYNQEGDLMSHHGIFETTGNPVATFARASTAYKQDGTQVASGQPRFESGGVMIEEGCINLIQSWPTGWAVSGNAGMAAVNQGTIAGAALSTIKLTNSGSIVGYYSNYSTPFTLAPSIEYTFRFKARGTVGTGKFGAHVLSNTGTVVQLSMVLDLSSTFKEFRATFTTTADISGTNQYIRFDHIGNDSGYIEIAEISLIQKPYSLTFPGYGATRTNETLTVPTSGVLNASEGEISIDVYIDPNGIHSATNPNYNMAFSVVTTQSSPYQEQNQISVRRQPSSTTWAVTFTNASGSGSTISLGSITSPGMYRITAVWKSGVGGYAYLNGVPKGSAPASDLPSAFDSTMYIGSWTGGALQINSMVKNFRVRDVMRSGAEILAEYQSGQMQVDDATTLLMTLNGTLLPTVRNFGLFAKNSRIVLEDPDVGQGIELWDGSTQKVLIGRATDGTIAGIFRGSKVYGSEVRTGDENSQEYVALTTDNRLLIVHNDKKVLETFAGSNQGHIFFYESGNRLGAVQAYSDHFRIVASDGSTDKRLLLMGGPIALNSANEISLTASYVYIGRSGASTQVTGNFHATGMMTAGDKQCTEKTSAGVVGLYTRESPEVRYIDEGRAELIDGQCRIDLDPIYLECIVQDSDETPWNTYLTPKGPFTIYEAELGDTYFIVKSKESGVNGKFTWKISAVRKNKAGVRFPRMEWLVGGDEENDPVLNLGWEDELLEGFE